MCTQELKIGTIPAVLYGEPAPNIWLFVHGQGGNKTEAAAFAALTAPTGWQVLGIDLPEHGDRTGETDFTPWQVVPELQMVLAYLQQHWQVVRLRANSIGAYFSMLAFAGATIEKALFVSPIVDMERLICDMMQWAKVTPEQLCEKGEITRVAFTNEQLHKYFPNSYTPAMMKREILALLKLWKKESWES